MAQTSSTLETLALELGKALQPLEELLVPDIFVRLGIELPPSIAQSPAVSAKLTDAKAAVQALTPDLTELAAALLTDDNLRVTVAGAAVISSISQLVLKLKDVGDIVFGAAAALPAADRDRVQQFAQRMAERVIEHMGVGYLVANFPSVTLALSTLGVIDKEDEPSLSLEVTHADREPRPRRLQLSRIPKLLNSPADYLKQVFGWGDPAFNGEVLFKRVQALLESLGVPAAIYQDPGSLPTLEAYLFSATVDTSSSPPALKLDLSIPGNATFDRTVDFSDVWKGTVHVHAAFAAGVDASIRPPFDISLTPPSGNIVLDVLLGAKAVHADGTPITILAIAGGTGLTAKTIGARAGVNANISSGSGNVAPTFDLEIVEGKLAIDFSKGDGFIQTLLSGIKFAANFDMRAHWNPRDGLKIQGSGGPEIFLPIHINLAIIEIQGLYFSLQLGSGTPEIGLKTQFKTNFGPLTAVIDQIGTNVAITFPENGQGRLGLADIGFKFAPPKGVGLSLDAGGFKGGGFLFFDPEKGEYAGALELDFNGIVTIKAIGVINTKFPDGSTGFSLLIVISAEFTPIQLSFGFTLNGVGGIFGLNRTIVVSALVEGIRTNAIKSILFPEDVIANITRIISDIKQFFPPQKDHFVVGPMAKLGWGTPSIITLELGLLLDLPNPMLIIVGVLKAVLPDEAAPLIRLQVNFIGVLDFEHGYVFFRADLYDSRLLLYSLTGSMAFLVSWGDQQVFALSVGGFHPDFRDIPSIPALPDGFRSMARIGISLLTDDNPRLKIETYYAVTSNTVQFGARVELYAAAAGFNVYGFLGFDVLFQFEPFRFIATLNGGIALRRGTSVIAGVTIHAQLSGPTPWDANGKASLKLFLFKVSVSFHVTWGDPPPALAAATEDLLKLLLTEFNDTRNWRAEIPANNNLHVTLKQIDAVSSDGSLVIHPAGILTFSQRSLPLEGFKIQKFGNKAPSGATQFTISNANSKGTPIPADFKSVKEQFAPGHFLELSDSEKLSRASFEKLASGFKLSGTSDLRSTLPVTRPVRYELSYLRRKKLEFKGLISLIVGVYDRSILSSAVRQSSLALQQRRIPVTAPPPVALPTEAFAIAGIADLKVFGVDDGGPVQFTTQSEAHQRRREMVARDPSLASKIQVVSSFELNPD